MKTKRETKYVPESKQNRTLKVETSPPPDDLWELRREYFFPKPQDKKKKHSLKDSDLYLTVIIWIIV